MTETPGLAEHLLELERQLLRPDVRASRVELDTLLAADFVEFGASGRIYNKASAIDALCAGAAHKETRIHDFSVRSIGPDAALVSYRAVSSAGEVSLRSSCWVKHEGHWRIVFHQGTHSA